MNSETIKILLIEDNPGDVRFLQEVLSEVKVDSTNPSTFSIECYNTLEKGFKNLSKRSFDIILLDLSLPDSQGYETFIKTQQKAPQIPIIVLTGFNDEMLAIQAVREGAQDYLVKGKIDNHLLTRSIHYAIERKHTVEENEKMQAQLFQSQKMEAVGTLAGGIAHDFNNLMTAIQGFTEMAMLDIEETDPLYNDLQEILIAANRATDLTRQLLLFSRKHPAKISSFNLNDTIHNLLNMIQRLIGEDIKIKTNFENDVCIINADQGSIEQVIMNLAVNSRDAMPNGGAITIKTENVSLNEVSSKTIPQARPGKFVCLSIADIGAGMSSEIVQHIFEPFFTTKGVGKGTGLGLSVVYGIVKQHGGFINVFSEPGKGTVFSIYLPIIVADFEKQIEESAFLKTPRGTGERVLVVEDEEGVREFAMRALNKSGYDVFEASSAEEALDIFEKENGNFHLILSDVVLPGKNGIELADVLLSRKPDLKVLLNSGYTDQKSQWLDIREKGFRFLQKPYTMAILLQTVKEVME